MSMPPISGGMVCGFGLSMLYHIAAKMDQLALLSCGIGAVLGLIWVDDIIWVWVESLVLLENIKMGLDRKYGAWHMDMEIPPKNGWA